MARIDDKFLDSVIYLYRSIQDAKEGKKSGGSGFLISMPSEIPGKHFFYVVTNRHVVEDARSRTLRINTQDGKFDAFETDLDDWFRADTDDLAILMVDVSSWPFLSTHISTDRFLTKELAERLKIGPGSATFLVGRFINKDGVQKNTPCARFGNIAMNPGEPVEHPSGNLQDSYLVESHSIGGFSGSPVFVYLELGDLHRVPAETFSDLNGWLLGVDWGHLDDWYPLRLGDKETFHPDGLGTQHNTGMAYVVPAWRLLDLLNQEEVAMQRKQVIEIHKRKVAESGVALDAVSPEESFTKEDFEAALRKVSRRLQPSLPDEGKSKT